MRFSTSVGIFFCAFLASLAMAAPKIDVKIENANVDRSPTGEIYVRWHSTPEGAPIDVFIGSQLVSDDDRDGEHTIASALAAHRPLIKLVAANGSTLVTAERLLPLMGGRNFRDLGGYRNANGEQVKWGRVFRSGTMTNLTDADYQLLSELGIRVVCDFRSDQERQQEPTNWRGDQVAYHTRTYGLESSSKALFGAGPPTAETVRAGMTQFYAELPYQHAESFRTMFKSLVAAELPLAFNCSAGKDRTGVAAALLLTMLGVPRQTILDDYALSDKIVNYEAEYSKQSTNAPEKGAALGFVARLPPEVRAPLLRSDPDYLRAALQSIEQCEGSFDAYFERVLTLGKAEQARIRELLLEKVDR